MNNKRVKEKSNKRILLTFILTIAACGGLGYFFGMLTAKSEETDTLAQAVDVMRDAMVQSFPVLFIIVAVLSIIIPTIGYIHCHKMYQKLQADRDNDELWDRLENALNGSMITSTLFSIANVCLFLCFVYGAVTTKIDERYGKTVVLIGLAVFVISTFMEILIPHLVVKIEKELNPEKKGNVLDSKFREVWMDSCDEAQQMMVYKAAYKAFSNTNMVCIWLVVITFVCAMLFKTDILSMIVVCLVWFVNTLSYMLHAAKLERRG